MRVVRLSGVIFYKQRAIYAVDLSSFCYMQSSGLTILIQAIGAGFAILTGLMAVISGASGTLPYLREESPDELQRALNEGVVRGFIAGTLPGIASSIIIVLTQ